MSDKEPTITPEADHSKVALTAYGVAYLRTFSDIPLTTEIFEALEGHMRASGQTYAPGTASKDHLAPQLEARYKLIDNLLAASGSTQVIELASGIAPRGMSTAMARPEINYVELDLPGVMSEKEAIFSRLQLPKPANLHFVAGNALSSEDVTSAATDFSPNKPVAVVNEGLMRYLTFPEKTVLAQNIYSLLETYGGVWITPDISLRSALAREDNAAKGHTDSLKRTTGIDVSQNVFEDVAQAQRFFENLGFAVEQHRFLEVSDELVSPAKLGMSPDDVTRLNEPCVAFVMRIAPLITD